MKKSNKKTLDKKTIYIILAVICLLAGLYLEYRDNAGNVDKEAQQEIAKATEENGNVGSEESIVSETEQEVSETKQQASDEQEETSIWGEGSELEDYVAYYFRSDKLLEQHYEKHGMEMGFDSMEEYEEAACAVIYNPDVLTKIEKEDGDYVYYVEESNEFVVVSRDGYIRTYFYPDAGIDYYNRQ